MKLLITGGAGFIGSNLARAFLKEGAKVRIIDNLITGKIENIEDIKEKVEFIEGDITDIKSLDAAVKGVDYILHEAAIPSVARSVEDPISSNHANVTGTLILLEAARKHGVKRVVYAASSSAYGDTPTLPKREDMTPLPLSPYAITKLTGEYYMKVYFELFGIETISLRYFNVFGPYQDPKSEYAAVIPRFITKILNDEQPVIFGDGLQTRDFCYIDNVIYANILALKAAKDALGKVYNIACGRRINLLQLVEMINRILGKDIKPIFDKPRPGDVKHSLADISLAKEKLNYEVKVDVEEGLKKTIEWFKTRRIKS